MLRRINPIVFVVILIGVIVALIAAFLVAWEPLETDEDLLSLAATSGNLQEVKRLVDNEDDAQTALRGALFGRCSPLVVDYAVEKGAILTEEFNRSEPSPIFGVVVEHPLHYALLNPRCEGEVVRRLVAASDSPSCDELRALPGVEDVRLELISQCS